MQMFLRIIIAVAGFVALPSESLPLAEFEPSTLTALGWASLRTSSAPKSGECPTLDGKYTNSGDEYYVMDDGLAGMKRENITTSPVVFFSHSRATPDRPSNVVTEVASETERVDQGTFSVRQHTNDGFLVFHMIAPRDSSKAIQATLQSRLGDYSCRDGKLFFIPKSFNSISEGVTSSYESQSFATILTDGSLFYYESSQSIARSMFIFTTSRNVQRYIRYLRQK